MSFTLFLSKQNESKKFPTPPFRSLCHYLNIYIYFFFIKIKELKETKNSTLAFFFSFKKKTPN